MNEEWKVEWRMNGLMKNERMNEEWMDEWRMNG